MAPVKLQLLSPRLALLPAQHLVGRAWVMSPQALFQARGPGLFPLAVPLSTQALRLPCARLLSCSSCTVGCHSRLHPSLCLPLQAGGARLRARHGLVQYSSTAVGLQGKQGAAMGARVEEPGAAAQEEPAAEVLT